jgi:hypothetical protein
MITNMNEHHTDVTFDIVPGQGIGPLRLGASATALRRLRIAGQLPVEEGRCLHWPGTGLNVVLEAADGHCQQVTAETGREWGEPLPPEVVFRLDGHAVQAMRWSEVPGLIAGRALDAVGCSIPSQGLLCSRYESDDEWVGYWRVQAPQPLDLPVAAGQRIGCIELGMSWSRLMELPACNGIASSRSGAVDLSPHGISCRLDEHDRIVAISMQTGNPAGTPCHLTWPLRARLQAGDLERLGERLRTASLSGGAVQVTDDGFTLPVDGLRLSSGEGELLVEVRAGEAGG